jgi:hypothetical protein
MKIRQLFVSNSSSTSSIILAIRGVSLKDVSVDMRQWLIRQKLIIGFHEEGDYDSDNEFIGLDLDVNESDKAITFSTKLNLGMNTMYEAVEKLKVSADSIVIENHEWDTSETELITAEF